MNKIIDRVYRMAVITLSLSFSALILGMAVATIAKFAMFGYELIWNLF